MKTELVGAAAVAVLLTLSIPAARADSTATVDLTPQLQSAGLDVDGLRAIEIGGIVVLRGRAVDAATAQHAGVVAAQLGYTRVANLIQVIEPPNDAVIQRAAERRLALQRSLDGCNLRVDSNRGIVTIAGKVHSAMQKDVAVGIVRNIDGVRGVRADFSD